MHRLAIGMIALLLPSALVACSSSSSDDNDGPDSQGGVSFTKQTAEPSGQIDTVNWGVPGSEPTTLDWIYSWDYGPGNLILSNVCEGLTRQMPDGSTAPALAQSIDTPDDTTFVYNLREGVTFSNGDPVTAEDVAFSLNRNLTAEPPSYWGMWYTNVKSIAVTGDEQVTVYLKQPDMVFASVMSTPAGYVGQKSFIEAAGAKYGTPGGGLMCTGPYEFDSWERGQSVTLKANPTYWDTSLRPKAGTFKFSFVPDPSALNSALLAGDLDGAWTVDVSSLKALSQSTNGKVYFNQGTENIAIKMYDLNSGPLSDIRIRQALRAAIPYDGITQGILGGYADSSTTPTPEATWGYAADVFKEASDELPGGKTDLDEAKALIKEAGAPSEPIVLAVSADDQSIVKVATAIQDSVKDLGLDLEVRKFPASEFTNLFYDASAREGLSGYISSATADVPDPLQLLIQVAPSSPFNYTGIKDEKLESTLQQAVATSDPTERATLTADAITHFTDEVYSISLYNLFTRVYLNNKITGVPVSSLSQWYFPWAATIGAS